ncbi:glutamate carboxypeptidase [Penicillium macrosclerotiorum]|uniref:glutamate carboxypeptidase n=1 Tax=Penicillium macrosclerotiorum TaxID=303699 RepID=UPI002548063E|nr:glutamate carboxypeptidase [Penicillium macrosclerotiorum]KAJ5678840.1 glutamate carboxypeptidase [Penicillium macrosclerotiorum]
MRRYASVLQYPLADPELIEYVGVPKTEVAKWAGITSAVASICQAIMAVPWGTLSDYIGRKPVILSGQVCTMVLTVMMGMSQTLSMVLVTRAMIGLMNGNVGIIRTMVAEIVPERELQPRAFSIMPLVWTIGSIFGPAIGGALARPAEKYPYLFGGSEFLRRFPFALPNLFSACFFIFGIGFGFLFLKETLDSKKERYDPGLVLGKALTASCASSRKRKAEWKGSDEETTLLPAETRSRKKRQKPGKRPTWSQIFTPQSNLVLLSYTLLSGLGMAFDSVFPVFLHYPEQQLHDNPDVQLPFKFAGGFGIDSQKIGVFYTIIGVIGMVIQFYCFPPIAKRYGTLACYKASAILMPIIFFITPFIALVPEALRIPAVLIIMLAKLGATVFGVPCCTILLANSASSLDVLGTLNGVSTSVSALGRAAGPALIGAAFSFGVKKGYVIIPWWLLGVLGFGSVVPSFWIVEQEGPYRKQEGEEEENEDEAEGEEEEALLEGSRVNGYGAIDAARDSGAK